MSVEIATSGFAAFGVRETSSPPPDDDDDDDDYYVREQLPLHR
jgi:hypothetical protein